MKIVVRAGAGTKSIPDFRLTIRNVKYDRKNHYEIYY